MTTEAAAG